MGGSKGSSRACYHHDRRGELARSIRTILFNSLALCLSVPLCCCVHYYRVTLCLLQGFSLLLGKFRLTSPFKKLFFLLFPFPNFYQLVPLRTLFKSSRMFSLESRTYGSSGVTLKRSQSLGGRKPSWTLLLLFPRRNKITTVGAQLNIIHGGGGSGGFFSLVCSKILGSHL